MSNSQYCIQLNREDGSNTATSRVRDFSLQLGCTAGDSSVGFNPVETLLSAAGACITSSLRLVAENSKVPIGRVEVLVSGIRQSDPPRLISVEIEVGIESRESDDRISRVFRVAGRNSTVVSTLAEVLDLDITWKRLNVESPGIP